MTPNLGAVEGRIIGVHVKPRVPGKRGLPKRAVSQARIGRGGVEGDHNVYREERLSGDPDSAVLLMPLETLRQLQGEGWPVEPGHLGENLTTQGLPYDAMTPGRRLEAGDAVVEVSRACDPCRNLYLLPYVGSDRGPAFLAALRGRRGWYARVVSGGVVRAGDPARLVA